MFQRKFSIYFLSNSQQDDSGSRCGNGIHQRLRACFGQTDTLKCEGKHEEKKHCSLGECTFEWTWTDWEECTCNSIYSTRQRECRFDRRQGCYRFFSIGNPIVGYEKWKSKSFTEFFRNQE
jgi:hypothetical protein